MEVLKNLAKDETRWKLFSGTDVGSLEAPGSPGHIHTFLRGDSISLCYFHQESLSIHCLHILGAAGQAVDDIKTPFTGCECSEEVIDFSHDDSIADRLSLSLVAHFLVLANKDIGVDTLSAALQDLWSPPHTLYERIHDLQTQQFPATRKEEDILRMSEPQRHSVYNEDYHRWHPTIRPDAIRLCWEINKLLNAFKEARDRIEDALKRYKLQSSDILSRMTQFEGSIGPALEKLKRKWEGIAVDAASINARAKSVKQDLDKELEKEQEEEGQVGTSGQVSSSTHKSELRRYAREILARLKEPKISIIMDYGSKAWEEAEVIYCTPDDFEFYLRNNLPVDKIFVILEALSKTVMHDADCRFFKEIGKHREIDVQDYSKPSSSLAVTTSTVVDALKVFRANTRTNWLDLTNIIDIEPPSFCHIERLSDYWQETRRPKDGTVGKSGKTHYGSQSFLLCATHGAASKLHIDKYPMTFTVPLNEDGLKLWPTIIPNAKELEEFAQAPSTWLPQNGRILNILLYPGNAIFTPPLSIHSPITVAKHYSLMLGGMFFDARGIYKCFQHLQFMKRNPECGNEPNSAKPLAAYTRNLETRMKEKPLDFGCTPGPKGTATAILNHMKSYPQHKNRRKL